MAAARRRCRRAISSRPAACSSPPTRSSGRSTSRTAARRGGASSFYLLPRAALSASTTNARVARAQPPRRLASVHADEGARDAAARADRARRGRVALRLRRPPLSRRGELVVGQPVRPRESADQRGARRAARRARARDARRLHASAASSSSPSGSRRSRRRASATRSTAPTARRRPRSRSRWRSTTGGTAASRTRRGFVCLAGSYHGETLGALAVTDVRALPRHLRAAAHAQRDGAVARTRAAPRPANRRATSPSAPRGARRASRRASRDDRRVHRRAAGAGRVGHGDVRPALPRARARALHALRRAADRRRDHDGLRPHRHAVRLRAGRRSRRISCACRRASPAATCRCRACCRPMRSTPRSTPTTSRAASCTRIRTPATRSPAAPRSRCSTSFATTTCIAANRAQGRALDGARRAARRASAGARFPPARHDLGVRRRHRRAPTSRAGASPRASRASSCCGRSAAPSTSCRPTS